MSLRRKMQPVAAIILAVSLAACQTVGRDFARPAPGALELGVLKRADFLKVYGEPYRQESKVTTKEAGKTALAAISTDAFRAADEGGAFATLVYLFAIPSSGALNPTAEGRRVLYAHFWNDTLVGYNFVSSFANDSSNFNEARVDRLEKGKTSYADTIALLGEPTGRGIYPVVKVNGDRLATYQYVQVDAQKRMRTSKRLDIMFDPNGVLRDYRFASADDPLPPPAPSPAPVYVPIITPRR